MHRQAIGPSRVVVSLEPATPRAASVTRGSVPTVVSPQSIGPARPAASVVRPVAHAHEPPPVAPVPPAPVAVRPEPEGTRPQRDLAAWLHAPAPSSPSPADPHRPIPLAYRVIDEFLEEGRRAAERWAQPISLDRLPHLQAMPGISGALQQLVRMLGGSHELLEQLVRLLQGATPRSPGAEPQHDRPAHVDPFPDERRDQRSYFGPDTGYIRNPDNRRPT